MTWGLGLRVSPQDSPIVSGSQPSQSQKVDVTDVTVTAFIADRRPERCHTASFEGSCFLWQLRGFDCVRAQEEKETRARVQGPFFFSVLYFCGGVLASLDAVGFGVQGLSFGFLAIPPAVSGHRAPSLSHTRPDSEPCARPPLTTPNPKPAKSMFLLHLYPSGCMICLYLRCRLWLKYEKGFVLSAVNFRLSAVAF